MPNKKLRNQLEKLFTSKGVAKDAEATAKARAAAASAPGDLASPSLGWTWETDSEGVFTFCSLEVTSILGFTPEEILGKTLTDISEPDAVGVRRQLTEAIYTGHPLVNLHLKTKHKEGRFVSLILNSRPIQDEADHLTGHRGIAQLLPFAAEAQPEPSAPAPSAPAGVSPPLPQPARPAPQPQPTRLPAAREGWQAYSPQPGRPELGYLDSPVGIVPLGDLTTSEMTEALTHGELVLRDPSTEGEVSKLSRKGRAMALPIQLQNEMVGALNFFDEGSDQSWSEDDIALAQAVADQLALALENARLFNETRDYLAKQTLLYEVTRSAASATNLKQALQSAVEAVSRVLPDSNVAILLIADNDRTLETRAAVGFPADTPAFSVGEGITGWVAQTNQPALIADIRQDARHRATRSSLQSISQVAVPLALGERAMGVLNVESPRANAFNDQDVQLLSTLAGTLSAIIVNNKLIEQITRERERLALLYEALRALTVSLDLNTTLNTALQFAPRLGAQHASLLLLGETQREATFYSTIPGLERLIENEAREYAQIIAKQGLESWVLENQHPALVKDTRVDERWFIPPAYATESEPVRSVISVPLKTQRGFLTGVLTYTHSAPHSLTEDQLPLVESIAGQVAVALENARLYQQMSVQQRNATALARATQAMSRTLSEQDVLEVLANELLMVYEPKAVIILHWESVTNLLTPLVVHLDPSEIGQPAWPVIGENIPTAERTDLLDVLQSGHGGIQPLPEEAENQIRQSMALPLLYGGEIEGVVEVVYGGPPPGLSQHDLDLFRAVLISSSSALQTARLYELQRATAERLAELDRLKSQFLANMSHELRTPLNSIIGFSRVILKGIDGPLTELQVQDLSSINSSGTHLLGLINDVLDMAKVDAGKMELVFDDTNLNDLIQSGLSTVGGLLKDKQIELRQEIAPDIPTVRADHMRIRQVLINLLSNAAKFTETGSITVHAHVIQATSPQTGKMAPFVEVSVTDTGPGIAQEDMIKLFEAFSQVDASPTRKAGGSGLGLNISRHLVELHGGRIWAESEVGRGSTFTFILPIHQPEPESEETTADGTPSTTPVVMAVDDDQGVITLYRRYLEPRGYKVMGISKSLEAVAQAIELKPKAILLDVLMPNKNGWQVLADLKRNEATRDIPVIMCTLVADEERSVSMGATHHLVKPILEADLLRALNKDPSTADPPQAILVIDDQEEDVRVIRRALEGKNGFRIIEAGGGRAGIIAARTERPQMIILDLVMPGTNGFEVLATLRNDPSTRDIPVLVVTSADLSMDDQQRLRLQVSGLLRKGGFSDEELFQDVERALAKARI